jgi:HK97 family phage major capsid protein
MKTKVLDRVPTIRELEGLPADQRRLDLRGAIDDLYSALTDITAATKAASRPMLASEQREWDEITDRLHTLEVMERDVRNTAPSAADIQRAAGRGGWQRGDGDDTAHRPGTVERYAEGVPLTRSQTFEGYVRARNLASESDVREPLDFGKYVRGMVTGNWRGADPEKRAMAEGTTTAGGYFIPTLVSSQIIDLARAKAVCMDMGAQIVPMENEKLNVAKWTGDPTAAWKSENIQAATSDPTVGVVSLVAQALTSLTVVSRELLEDVDGIGDTLLNAFAKAFALKFDQAMLRGTGTAPEPRGIKNTSGITATAWGGANGASPTWDMIVDNVGILQDANETVSGIVSAPRLGRSLSKLKATTNDYIDPPASVGGIPQAYSTQIPTNLTVGTSTDCTEVYIGDFNQLILGARTQLVITPLVERYADYGQVGFLAWARADVAVARPAAFNLLTGVRP